MTKPRSSIVSVNDTPYYHCVSRCVRRAHLCGEDLHSGRSFDHRKLWIVERLKLLTEVFTIDIAAYAIMSNHYHLVLHIDQKRAYELDTRAIISRWLRLYKGPQQARRYLDGEPLNMAETQLVGQLAEIWRKRLCDLSWFMRCLNEYIARKANQEDDCTGRFWEGRFKSQALLDEAALISTMAYVDLNPIRAKMASNLQNSDYTSVQQRIQRIRNPKRKPSIRLMGFTETIKEDGSYARLPHNLKDYLELVDMTGRSVRRGKRGFITTKQPALLKALNISSDQWRFLTLDIQKKSILMLKALDQISYFNNRARNDKAA